MTDFNPGDRVRIVRDKSISAYNGVTGAIDTVANDNLWPIRVIFDEPVAACGNIKADIFDPDEIELIIAESEPSPTPADPELQALRERLLDKTIKAIDFGADADTIVTIAKAFEAYVTGDTK